ncbi:MAG: Crp/Fnr family transcriptional regulator, partial [Desulfobacterales bacterium]
GPGTPFGEVPVCAGRKFPANAQTLLKSHLHFFPRTEFVELISKNGFISFSPAFDSHYKG